MSLRFLKSERLCSKKDIDKLFAEGLNVRSGSLSIKWIIRDFTNDECQRQVLVVVPKRNVRKAVDRNRVKRQLREIYRINKLLWKSYQASPNKTLLIGVIYLGGADPDFQLLKEDYFETHRKFIKHASNQKVNNN